MLKSVLLLTVLCYCTAKPVKDRFLQYALKHPNLDENNPEYGELYDGDIILPEGKSAQDVQMDEFNIIPGQQYRWPNNILYYEIRDPSYTATQVQQIEDGIADLMEKTMVNGQVCIEIRPRTNQQNYVYVEKGSGCSSYVGMIGGSQRISLADGCFRHGTIMHEFLHAWGYHHEHKRADRDDYIEVNFDNIEPGKEHNFDKLVEGVTIDQLGTSYDYGSVMHYGAYGFAIDSSIPTIIPLDPDAEIGQRTHLSALDIERVQIAYNCLSVKDSKYFKHLA